MSPDARAIADAVRSGRLTARAVAIEAIERARADDTNAVVTVCDERAMREAAAVDRAIARGEAVGVLAGVPFTAKDTIATAGVRTTAGSRLFANFVPDRDAACIDRMRSAGAVLVGKTNCPEFALQARTDNLVFGATRHPRDAAMSPGGSSGGCAAAVAAGIVPLSIGGDYGGSIRYPAGCTGIFGLRPGRGAIPTAGTLPDPAPGSPRHHFQTVGPLTRTIDDLALAWSVLSQRDEPDETAMPRVGIGGGGWPIDASGARALARAATAAGAHFDVTAIDTAPFVHATAVFDAWRATDDYDDLRELVGSRTAELTPHVRTLLTAGRAETTDAQRESIAGDAQQLMHRVTDALDETPVVVLPIALVGVMRLAATEVEIGGRVEPLDSLRILAPSRAISLLGLPALAVPAGTDDRGLPVGVQLVGRAGAEAELFTVARALVSIR